MSQYSGPFRLTETQTPPCRTLKLMDYFVTLDGVRQRSYQAIRMNVLGG